MTEKNEMPVSLVGPRPDGYHTFDGNSAIGTTAPLTVARMSFPD